MAAVKSKGISVKSNKLRPEVLIEMLCRHALEYHGSQSVWKDFTKINNM